MQGYLRKGQLQFILFFGILLAKGDMQGVFCVLWIISLFLSDNEYEK